MNILHVSHSPSWDGHTNRILNECIELKNRNYNIDLYAQCGRLIKEAIKNNINVITKVDKTLINDFDIIHTHCVKSMEYISSIIDRSIFIAGIHFSYNNYLRRSFFPNNIDKIVCVSDYDALEYQLKYPFLSNKIISIPTSIKVSDFNSKNHNEANQLKDSLNINPTTPIIGSLIRKNPIKGYEILLNIAENKPNLNFILIGSGMEELNQKLPNLIGIGIQKDIKPFLSIMDIYIQPSLKESLGTAILEAAASRIPIIASNIGGIPDFIENNVNGILFNPQYPEEAIKAIDNLLLDKELSSKFIDAAYEKVSKQFNINNMIDKLSQLYDSFKK